MGDCKGYTGEGIAVAVIDSGINAVDELAVKIVYSQIRPYEERHHGWL